MWVFSQYSTFITLPQKIGIVINKEELFASDTDHFTTEIDYELLPDNDGGFEKYELDITDQKVNIVLNTVPDNDTSDVLRIQVIIGFMTVSWPEWSSFEVKGQLC